MHNEWNAFRNHIQLAGLAITYHTHRATGAYATYDDPLDHDWEQANSHLLNGWTRESFAEAMGYRGMTLREFFMKKEEIEQTPLPVMLEIREAPPWSHDVDLYQPNMPYAGYGKEAIEPPLIVHTVPLPGFIDLMGPNGKVPEGTVDYHISLCFTNELGRFDLFKWNDGVTKGREVYEEFRQKWNGKPALARVSVATGGAADILSLISEDEGDLMKRPCANGDAQRRWLLG